MQVFDLETLRLRFVECNPPIDYTGVNVVFRCFMFFWENGACGFVLPRCRARGFGILWFRVLGVREGVVGFGLTALGC